MANLEKLEEGRNELNLLIAEARNKSGKLDARKALSLIISRLQRGSGYYTWVTLGEGPEQVWQCRIPRTDMKDEEDFWIKDEDAEIIHICNPVNYLEASHVQNKEKAAESMGAVRDADNLHDDYKEFKCVRCGRRMPEKLGKAAIMHVKLNNLRRSRCS